MVEINMKKIRSYSFSSYTIQPTYLMALHYHNAKRHTSLMISLLFQTLNNIISTNLFSVYNVYADETNLHITIKGVVCSCLRSHASVTFCGCPLAQVCNVSICKLYGYGMVCF